MKFPNKPLKMGFACYLAISTIAACNLQQATNKTKYPVVFDIVDGILIDNKGNEIKPTGQDFRWQKVAFVKIGNAKLANPLTLDEEIAVKLHPITASDRSDTLILNLYGSQEKVCDWRAVLLPNGRILISGGAVVDSDSSSSGLDSTWIFNPADGSVIDGPKLVTKRCQHSMTVLNDGRVFLAGGNAGFRKLLATCEILDLKSKSSTQFGSMRIPRDNHAAVQLRNNAILIVGGTTTPDLADEDYTVTSTVEVFDLENQKSLLLGRLHVARERPQVIPVYEDQALVIGGQGEVDLPIQAEELLKPGMTQK